LLNAQNNISVLVNVDEQIVPYSAIWVWKIVCTK
jgi:hypothetical protein